LPATPIARPDSTESAWALLSPQDQLKESGNPANRKTLIKSWDWPLAANAKGYHGHDEMAVVETVVARRFPIYGAGDPPLPSGRTRQLQYKLKPGEVGWVLTLDRVVEY
jgi:hypothetical protein